MRQLLSVSTTPIRLEYNGSSGTRGQYNMRSPHASLDINLSRPELKVNAHPIKIHIDRREMYASMGVYLPEQFRRKTEQEAKEAVMETIGQTGDDARAMALTQGAAFESICQRKGGFNPVELETAYLPSVKPEITWEGGEISDVSFSPFKMDINWVTHVFPDVEYKTGRIDISVSQWHKVNIAYTGTEDDVTVVGKKLNFKI